MNCEKCQDLISDFLDGALSHEDQSRLNSHLEECLGCADIRNDLHSIVDFCSTQRGVYVAPPNEKALWQRIRNVIEADASAGTSAPVPARRSSWSNWIGRSWELSFPQLVASAVAIVLVVSLSTAVGLRRWQSGESATFKSPVTDNNLSVSAANVRSRISQQEQLISYWNQRVEFNKARWNPQMRETFDRNLKVIDQA
nr:anti-sigma factor [Acidobacteriota bacterium]